MSVKGLSIGLTILLSVVSFSATADTTKSCNDSQKANCTTFCQEHQQMKSCIVDVSKMSGTCTCGDGTSHTKSKS